MGLTHLMQWGGKSVLYRWEEILQAIFLHQSLSQKSIEKHIKQGRNYQHRTYQVAIKPLVRLGLNASAIVSVRNARHNSFVDSMMGFI